MPNEKPPPYEDYVTLESLESRGSSESFENWLSPFLADVYWKLTDYLPIVSHPVSILPTSMINES
jgi:hypothetical protein